MTLYSLLTFILHKDKNQKPGLYRQQVENILAFNTQFFCQQIHKKSI